jgi:uncharacterized protein YcfL
MKRLLLHVLLLCFFLAPCSASAAGPTAVKTVLENTTTVAAGTDYATSGVNLETAQGFVAVSVQSGAAAAAQITYQVSAVCLCAVAFAVAVCSLLRYG